jgi:tetratricopeptide (TPR) repeat protein
MSRIVVSALCVVALLGLARPAVAESVSDAREHYLKAQSHYAVGEFVEAGEEYQTAYKLKNDPALLYDAAQSFRLGGKLEKALILYRNYLQFYPDEAAAPMVKQRIAELKEAIASSEHAKTSPPTTPVPANTEPTSTTGNATAPAQTTSTPALVQTTETAPAPKKTPTYKKWWVWTIVGGVAAAGVGVGLGLGLTSGGTQHLNPTLGDFGPGAMHTTSLVRF